VFEERHALQVPVGHIHTTSKRHNGDDYDDNTTVTVLLFVATSGQHEQRRKVSAVRESKTVTSDISVGGERRQRAYKIYGKH
jgi:hypothetical protein